MSDPLEDTGEIDCLDSGDGFDLSPEQAQAYELITSFLDSDKLMFKLGGYAGTGKTTLIRKITTNLSDHFAVAAFTGKAVSVLKNKGIDKAQTLHSLIYDTEIVGGLYIHTRKKRFAEDFQLVIVDEASMVSTELYDDLCELCCQGTKLLFVGDPGQLEPVGDNPELMKKPDFTLSQIHRQAAKSPIISFATDVRMGKPIPNYSATPELEIRPGKGVKYAIMETYDQAICGTNRVRHSINRGFRKHQGRPLDKIVAGDKLIVLRNNRDFDLFNGSIITIDSVEGDLSYYWIVMASHDGQDPSLLPIWKDPIKFEDFDTTQPAPTVPSSNWSDLDDRNHQPNALVTNFAYCITCHKSQGSEWDKVIVFDEKVSAWDLKRWRYTAITRAAKHLTYCI